MGAETERLRRTDLRLVPVAAACWTAAAWGVVNPAHAGTAAAILWAVVAAVVVALVLSHAGRFTRSRAGAALVLAAVALAGAAAALSAVGVAEPARTAAGSLPAGGGRSVVVEATVTGSSSRTAAGGVLFDADARSIRIGPETHTLRVPVKVLLSKTIPVGLGDTIMVRGTVRPTGPGERPVFIVFGDGDARLTGHATGALQIASVLRRGLVTATGGLPQPGAGLIPGLAVGDTTAVTAELDADMKASSLTHLTAVSGANCAVVVGIAFGLAALCGARRIIRVGCGLAALAGFVVLVTPEPSVVRAAMMAAIAMLALLLGRARLGIALLLLAVVVALLADPWLAMSVGFALSAAATGALLVLARPLAAGLARWMPRTLAFALSVPLSAQLVCGPLLVLLTPTIPVFGVVANLLAEPAAPAATVLGLAACLALPLPVLQAGLTALTWVPAAWIAATARLFAQLPGHGLPWFGGVAGAAALALLSAGIVWLLVPAVPGRTARRIRAAVAAGVAIALGVWGGFATLGGVAAPLTVPRDWSVALCDVGQGDAILLRSQGRIALIDTGPDPEPLATCLHRFGISRIDLLVLTHYDHDHVGGVEAVRGRADVVLHGPPDSPRADRLLRELAASGADVVDAAAGMRGPLGAASWTVLWPLRDGKAYPPGNESCVVLDIRGPGMPTGLFLGDTDEVAQAAILRTGGLRPPYEVVKVAHHGSADQDPPLYAALRAPVALISVGAGNDYGHPRAPTLQFLAADRADIHRTDQEGIVTVTETSAGPALWHEHDRTAPQLTPGR
ncbi:ComEC/Rec2 family competence protein [Microbacterium mangrovi]|uniref:ComEC/Rec2 family competence protein n=1 Tax=Microbacterium mangrovi TaxID=1348253 RepID=UPI00068DA3D0|nr:ComEC/Rec2 family competence protein [Microbacterium mangrovi]